MGRQSKWEYFRAVYARYEQADRETKQRMGTERSRGYCLELVCAAFLAGRGEESSPEEILTVIHRFVGLLPPEYQGHIARHQGPAEAVNREVAGRC
jgi:hypothetical protein